jgi:hypothetical protein
MRISGLSNQWKTRDGLFGEFADEPEFDPVCNERSRVIRELLLHLESRDGPDLWIGTSHRLLNFNLRDTTYQFDRIPTFVTVESFDITRDPPTCGYRVGFSITGDQWEHHDIIDVEEAASMILRLIPGAGR